jgi:hypothetical protein
MRKLADQPAKEAAQNKDATISNKIPKGTLISEIERNQYKNGRKNGLNVWRKNNVAVLSKRTGEA